MRRIIYQHTAGTRIEKGTGGAVKSFNGTVHNVAVTKSVRCTGASANVRHQALSHKRISP